MREKIKKQVFYRLAPLIHLEILLNSPDHCERLREASASATGWAWGLDSSIKKYFSQNSGKRAKN